MSGTSTNTASGTSSTVDGNFGFFGGYSARIPQPAPRPSMCSHMALGVPCDAPWGDVKRAYRRLAKIAHPDLAPPWRKAELGNWMALVNRLYEVLERSQ